LAGGAPETRRAGDDLIDANSLVLSRRPAIKLLQRPFDRLLQLWSPIPDLLVPEKVPDCAFPCKVSIHVGGRSKTLWAFSFGLTA
jgi:hypothetical protein